MSAMMGKICGFEPDGAFYTGYENARASPAYLAMLQNTSQQQWSVATAQMAQSSQHYYREQLFADRLQKGIASGKLPDWPAWSALMASEPL